MRNARISPALMLNIAGFLAGDMALGSLASLNIASRAIRTVTMPVLYETVILDNNIATREGAPLRNWMALNSGKQKYVK
jgi:hypothetical protein